MDKDSSLSLVLDDKTLKLSPPPHKATAIKRDEELQEKSHCHTMIVPSRLSSTEPTSFRRINVDSAPGKIGGQRIEKISQSLKRKFPGCEDMFSPPLQKSILSDCRGRDATLSDKYSAHQDLQAPLDLRSRCQQQAPASHSKVHKSISGTATSATSARPEQKSDSTEDKHDSECVGGVKGSLTVLHNHKNHMCRTEPNFVGSAQKSVPGRPARIPGSNQNGFRQKEVHTDTQSELDEKEYFCSECNKSFSHRVFLDIHQKTHKGDGQSEVINFDLSSAESSGPAPRRRKKREDDRPYHCNVCRKCFARSTHLVQHMRMHTGEKPYSCDICGKKFARGVHLSDHKRLHSGERPYVCGYCAKDFSQRSHLTQHMRIHTGEKPYKCDVCDKSFTDSSTLNRHKKKHVGGKKELIDSSTLKRHTGGKAYKRDGCDKSFTDSSTLNT